jgi:hypothetical protein
MAHKMRKFSDGGALGKYNRRMADIEKDFKKDSAGKSGKALEVLEAKRMQRTADAEDDRAKRTGGDRTATRAAERAAESNLTKTRKYGAPKAVTKDTGPVAKITESLSVPKMDSSIGAKPKANTPVQKPVQKPAAKPARMGDQGFAYKKKDMPTTGEGVSTHYRYVRGGSRSGAAADGTAAQRLKNKGLETEGLKTGNKGTSAALLAPKGSSSRSGSFGDLFKTSDSFKASQERKYGKSTPTISGTDTNASITYGDAAAKKNAANKAKGGKIMKYAKGGSTPPQPTPADRARSKKQLDELKKLKPTDKEGKVAGSANRSEGPGYKKGGKMATKFGAAMKKKSADTKGRAMPKFAKGGSIDGCAVKGKTKTSMIKMKNGGSC